MDRRLPRSCRPRWHLLEVDLRLCLDMLWFARHNGSFGKLPCGDNRAGFLFLMRNELFDVRCCDFSSDDQKLG